MINELEAMARQERCIFLGIETGVVERLTVPGPDSLSAFSAAREHQGGPRERVRLKDRKHSLLIFRREVKEAVPSHNTSKPFGQIKLPHVCHDPVFIWETLATKGDQ
jgi:hypothetical protein